MALAQGSIILSNEGRNESVKHVFRVCTNCESMSMMCDANDGGVRIGNRHVETENKASSAHCWVFVLACAYLQQFCSLSCLDSHSPRENSPWLWHFLILLGIAPSSWPWWFHTRTALISVQYRYCSIWQRRFLLEFKVQREQVVTD
jgi:hypothetical protein